MAIYHCSTKPLARSSGRSAVAAAAYRSGDCLVDERQGLEHDYTLPDELGEAERQEVAVRFASGLAKKIRLRRRRGAACP